MHEPCCERLMRGEYRNIRRSASSPRCQPLTRRTAARRQLPLRCVQRTATTRRATLQRRSPPRSHTSPPTSPQRPRLTPATRRSRSASSRARASGTITRLTCTICPMGSATGRARARTAPHLTTASATPPRTTTASSAVTSTSTPQCVHPPALCCALCAMMMFGGRVCCCFGAWSALCVAAQVSISTLTFALVPAAVLSLLQSQGVTSLTLQAVACMIRASASECVLCCAAAACPLAWSFHCLVFVVHRCGLLRKCSFNFETICALDS